MGDWIVRTHWAIAPDEVTALAAYERLEEIAGEIRREGDFESGTSILRFGFGSPRLVIAEAAQKWGSSTAIGRELARMPGVRLLATESHDVLAGSIAALEPEYLFAWSHDDGALAALGRAGLEEAWVGAVRVRVLDRDTAAALLQDAGDGAILDPSCLPAASRGAELVVGVVSRVHGLVPLAQVTHGEVTEVSLGAEPMQLHAQRIEGGNNSTVIRDHVKLLPETLLLDDVAWRLERHGPHHVFLSTAQRAAMVRAALASPSELERRAGRAMMRRWGLLADGARAPVPCRPRGEGALEAALEAVLARPRGEESSAVRRYADALRGGDRWLDELAAFREVGARLDDVVRAGHADRLRELACRFAELAHAVSRTSYWMVRDGACGPDVPELPARPLEKIWSGEPRHVADQISFWAAAAALAMHERERHPARAAIAALIALEAAVATATRVWWTPATGWLAAVAHADVTLDADADVDPTIAADPDLDPAAARAALAEVVRGEALVDDEPARAAATLEAALGAARAANAPVLALRARYRWLGALKAMGDEARFTAEAERLLADLPSPVAIFPLGAAGELAAEAIQWAANGVAWDAHARGDHARCLEVIERALLFAKPTEWHDNIRDTKVRALLALGRADEAHAIVHEVLARAPGFEVFADLAASDAYRAWCDRRATPPPSSS